MPRLTFVLTVIFSVAILLTMLYITSNVMMPRMKPQHEFRRNCNLLDTTEEPKSVLLVVGILSKLSAISRRESIRFTSMRDCESRSESVICRFFTDKINTTNKTAKSEQFENDDMIFMPYKGKCLNGV